MKLSRLCLILLLSAIIVFAFSCNNDSSSDDDDDDNDNNDSIDDDTNDDDTGDDDDNDVTPDPDDDDTGDDDDDIVDASLVFIHHSVGEIWIGDGGLTADLEAAGFSFYDITYGDGWIGNHTYAWHWPTTFGEHYDEVLGWELPGEQIHDVVMIKSCYPDSVINAVLLESYKGWYNEILEIFLQHPETGFLVITPPPHADDVTASAENIARGREFAYWLTHEYATKADNVRVVDLAGYLNDDFGFMHERTPENAAYFYLREECESEPDDSHPTPACISAANEETVTAALDLLP